MNEYKWSPNTFFEIHKYQYQPLYQCPWTGPHYKPTCCAKYFTGIISLNHHTCSVQEYSISLLSYMQKVRLWGAGDSPKSTGLVDGRGRFAATFASPWKPCSLSAGCGVNTNLIIARIVVHEFNCTGHTVGTQWNYINWNNYFKSTCAMYWSMFQDQMACSLPLEAASLLMTGELLRHDFGSGGGLWLPWQKSIS